MTVEIDNSGSAAIERQGPGSRVIMLHNRIDFSVSGNNLATTLSMGIFKIPAGVRIMNVDMRVITIDADVSDVDVGVEGGTEDGFIDGATLASTGLKEDHDETYSTPGAGFYDDTTTQVIAIKNNDADTINGAVVDFFAFGFDYRKPPYA